MAAADVPLVHYRLIGIVLFCSVPTAAIKLVSKCQFIQYSLITENVCSFSARRHRVRIANTNTSGTWTAGLLISGSSSATTWSFGSYLFSPGSTFVIFPMLTFVVNR